MSFAPVLAMNYEFTEDRIIFEDGTTYSLAEAVFMAKDKLSDVDIQAVHLVKKMFGGEIAEVVVRSDTVQGVKPNSRVIVDGGVKHERLSLPLDQESADRGQDSSLDSMLEGMGDLPMIGT